MGGEGGRLRVVFNQPTIQQCTLLYAAMLAHILNNLYQTGLKTIIIYIESNIHNILKAPHNHKSIK